MNDLKNISAISKNPQPGIDVRSIYFLGIGGIGMSALARYFLSIGVRVSGYDKTPTALTSQLEKEGAVIHFEDNVEKIDKQAEMVVYTPAVPKDHTELNYFIEHKYKMLKRSEVLALIMQNSFNICVAGTHGKTTTSAMLAHILRDTGYGCSAFLGGIAANYDTNFWTTAPAHNRNKVTCVAEADEYDRSFLQLSPDVAIITSMDADHLDIYGTEKKMQDAFIEFTGRIKSGGTLLYKKDLQREGELQGDHKLSYDVYSADASIHANNIRVIDGSYLFDVELKDDRIKEVQLNMGGMHNVENAVAAVAVAAHLGINEQKIKIALAGFKGVKRRFEYIVKNEAHIFIDDYAHHPQELRALIRGAKELFPGRHCTVIFQPHLFSRTRDLADEFAHALEMADQVILLPIYPARELPVVGITSSLVADKMTTVPVSVVEKEKLLNWLSANKTELLITSGAGDIDMLVEPIKNILLKK